MSSSEGKGSEGMIELCRTSPHKSKLTLRPLPFLFFLFSAATNTTSPSVLLPATPPTDFGSPSLLALGSPKPINGHVNGATTPLSPVSAIVGKPSTRVPDGEQTVGNMYPQRVVLTSEWTLGRCFFQEK